MDEATEALDEIRTLGWAIVEARPAGTIVAARDRFGNPSQWSATEPSFVAGPLRPSTTSCSSGLSGQRNPRRRDVDETA
jgi:hypothetical protein